MDVHTTGGSRSRLEAELYHGRIAASRFGGPGTHPNGTPAGGEPAIDRFLPERDAAGNACIVIRPNRSLSLKGLVAFVLSYVVLLGAIGVMFARQGAWLVLPFAGLEIAVVLFVCYLIHRHAGDCETIVVSADAVTITRRDGRRELRHEFQRYWVRITLERPARDWYPSRLLLGSHGRFVEVGASLLDEDRHILAGRLRDLARY